MHRSLSWLDAAEQADSNWDARFVFLWVAFNAAYAEEIRNTARVAEQTLFRDFIQRLLAIDQRGQLATPLGHFTAATSSMHVCGLL